MRPAVSDGAPKYSMWEQERRWLVDHNRLPPLGPGRLIEDRYVDGTQLRLRLVDGVGKLGKKYPGAGLSTRPIVSVYLDTDEHRILAQLPAAVLVKRRFTVDVDALRFTVDQFEGALAGLWLAEIEHPDPASLAAVTPPPWCIAEVTADPHYAGGVLARNGAPAQPTTDR